jgi:hypothetical protein
MDYTLIAAIGVLQLRYETACAHWSPVACPWIQRLLCIAVCPHACSVQP